MNKVVPAVLAMSAILAVTGCSSSGTKHSYSGVKTVQSSHSGNYSYAKAACATCGPGYHAVAHTHARQANGQVITHSHAGAPGHTHSGMSASHSYVSTASHAGRNTYVGTGSAAGGYGGGGASFAKIAGALLVGGLIYHATQDDDDDDNGNDDSGHNGGSDDK
ncbi:MAG: hypothetical protein CSB47_00145 [Proteobacteria bacterium]|nr:MAG: hypothetical protein CSB47_00145 [Pseudomonadota bacterium]